MMSKEPFNLDNTKVTQYRTHTDNTDDPNITRENADAKSNARAVCLSVVTLVTVHVACIALQTLNKHSPRNIVLPETATATATTIMNRRTSKLSNLLSLLLLLRSACWVGRTSGAGVEDA